MKTLEMLEGGSSSSSSQGLGELIPGLPADLVEQSIIPRLPYYSRPIMRAVCKKWKQLMDDPSLYASSTRQLQQIRGLLFWSCYHGSLLLLDEEHESKWRMLPPLPNVTKSSLRCKTYHFEAYDGMIFMLRGSKSFTGPNYGPGEGILVLDIGSGMWVWQIRSPVSFLVDHYDTLAFGGVILAVHQGLMQLVYQIYDIVTDEWNEQVVVKGSNYWRYNYFISDSERMIGCFDYTLAISDPRIGKTTFCVTTEEQRHSTFTVDGRIVSFVRSRGCLCRYDEATGAWVDMGGSLPCEAGGLRFEGSWGVAAPHVYALHLVRGTCVSMWRGDVDWNENSVLWEAMQPPKCFFGDKWFTLKYFGYKSACMTL